MNTITWLHLSDLHFRAGEQHTWDENIVLEALLEDVRARIREDGFRPDLILVSGDIAFSGKPEEYDLATEFFEELLRATHLRKDRIFPVPGNHDVDRRAISRGAQAIAGSLTDRESTNAVLNTAADRQLLFDRFRGYAGWINDYLGGHLSFDDERYYYVHCLDLAGQRLALLGLNSAWVAASDEDRARGLLLGERQTRSALREATQAGATLKIALLHHPFDWLREFDQSDSAALLLDRCDLVLHGHLHQAAATRLTSPDGEATILACGACYKTRQFPNMYNWLQLALDPDTGAAQGRIHLRRYSDARGGFWAPDTLTYRNVPDGVYSFPLRGLAPAPAAPPEPPATRQPPAPPPLAAEPSIDELLAGIRIDPDDPPYAVLRELLAESFGPQELQRFCQDRRELKPIVRQFAPAQGLEERIDRLLDFCRTRLLWDFLLREVATVRPQQVQRYAAQLGAVPGAGQESNPESGPGITKDTGGTANPFHDRGRINDPARFFGRQRLVRELRQMLAAGNSVSLVGQAQIGKSSLLYYLYQTRAEWLPGSTLLYLDLQQSLDEDDFCAQVLEGLGQTPGDLRALRRALRRGRTVLLLDEVEKLRDPGFPPRLQDVLRALAQEPSLTLAVSSHHRLVEIFPPSSLTSPFHNIFTDKEIPPFSDSEARAFLQHRLSGTGIAFTSQDLQGLWDRSGGHPARLQEHASQLFEDRRGT